MLINNNDISMYIMVWCEIDKTFYDSKGNARQGFQMDDTLYYNLTNSVILSVKNKFDSVFCISGMEGCSPAGTKVLLANGSWKNIEDMHVGDRVISPQIDGTIKIANVTWTTRWMSPMNYDVVSLYKRQRLYSCSFNHKLPIETVSGLRHFDAASYHERKLSMKKNDITYTSPLIPTFEGATNCEIEPYCLGLYLGNGSFTERSNQLVLSMNISDEAAYQEFFRFYPAMNITRDGRSQGVSFRFSLQSNLATLLTRYGLYDKRSGDKFIPKQALLSDFTYRKRLLAGLIDTDGYYNSKSGSYEYTSKSKQLAEDISWLVSSLGGRANPIKEVTKRIRSLNFSGRYYRFSFYLGAIELPILLTRKFRNDYGVFYKSPNRKSVDVVPIGAGEVFGFELDTESHWYITDNWYVTRNTGKSTFAFTIAHFLDHTFNLDRVVFSPEDLMKQIDAALPESSIVFDEAALGMFSTDSALKIQSILIKKFITIRKKRLYIILVIPSIFMLRKYFAIFRTKFLLHCYTPDSLTRGFFRCYGYEQKRKLYLLGQKMFDQGAVREDFVGRFVDTEGFFFSPEAYDAKKELAIRSLTSEMEDRKILTPQNKQAIIERDLLLMGFYSLFKYDKALLTRTSGRTLPDDYNVVQAPKDFVKFVKSKIGIPLTTLGLTKSIDRALLVMEEKSLQKEKKQKMLANIEIRE